MRTMLIAWLILLFNSLANPAFSQDKQPLWVFPVGAPVQSSPAIGTDGTIYFGADNGIFYALTPQGKKKWEFVTSGLIVSTPAVASDGTIYVTSIDKIVYAINPDGSEKWRIMPGSGIVASPAISPDGSIIIGTVFNKLFAISPDGFRKWEFPTMGNIISSAAIDQEGTIYVGCMDTNFYAISTNGAAVWIFTAGDKINSSPAIDKDGTLYFGSFDRSVYALAPNGKLRWGFKTAGAVRSSPVIGTDGEIYIGSDDKKIYAIGRDGLKKWEFETKDWVRSTPAISADGTIYVGSYDGNLYAINKDGSLKWILKTQGIVSSSPAIDANGIVYVGSWDGNFYAVKGESPLAKTPWPCFRKNIRRSGCEIDDTPPQKTSSPLTTAEPELRIPTKKVEDVTPIQQPILSDTQTGLTPISAKEKEQPAANKPLVDSALEKPSTPAQSASDQTSQTSAKSGSKPVIKITSPKDGTKVEESKIVVEGTAKDKKGIKSVQYRFNSARTGVATGLGKWMVPLALQPGKNTFEARCENLDGNFSDWEQIVIYYAPSYKIFAEVLGKGKIVPDISGKKFDAGAKIKLKAEPGKDYRFLAWHGSISDSSPQIDILVLSNMAIKAIFVPEEKQVAKETVKSDQKQEKQNERPPLAEKTTIKSGTYRALVYPESGEDVEIYGILSIVVGRDSNWSATLLTSEESLYAEGKLDKDKSSSASIKRGSKPPATIVLKIIETNNITALSGKISGLGKDLIFNCYPQRENDLSKSVKLGLYTSILAIPQKDEPPLGDGYAKIVVDEKGNAKIEGKLCDGTQFTSTSGVNANLTIPLFIKLNEGHMAGIIVFTNTLMSDLAGSLIWVKNSSNQGQKSEVVNLRVIGSHFSPEIGAKFITDTNLVIAFNGGGIATLLANMVYVTPENKIEIKYTDSNLKFSFDFTNGIYSGSFVHPVLKKPARFEGVFLQKAKWGSGYFICEDKTGIALIITDSEEVK